MLILNCSCRSKEFFFKQDSHLKGISVSQLIFLLHKFDSSIFSGWLLGSEGQLSATVMCQGPPRSLHYAEVFWLSGCCSIRKLKRLGQLGARWARVWHLPSCCHALWASAHKFAGWLATMPISDFWAPSNLSLLYSILCAKKLFTCNKDCQWSILFAILFHLKVCSL